MSIDEPRDPELTLAKSASGDSSDIARQQQWKQRVEARNEAEGILSRVFWFTASMAFVLCIWKLGPEVLEDYQYSMVKGKIRAEYENAIEMLDENPLSSVSDAYQLVAQKVRPSVVSVKAIKRNRTAQTKIGRASCRERVSIAV